MSVHRVPGPEPGIAAGLSELLIDCVEGGASVGFLAPLDRSAAEAWWTKTLSSLGSGLALWVAEEGGRIAGSVQLVLCEKPNGRHRAEIAKLMVHSAHRGRGLARRLLSEAESFARADGRTLLVLDTETGSAAEEVYRRFGWTKAGEIPRYAASPDGHLRPSSFYYKLNEP